MISDQSEETVKSVDYNFVFIYTIFLWTLLQTPYH